MKNAVFMLVIALSVGWMIGFFWIGLNEGVHLLLLLSIILVVYKLMEEARHSSE